LVGSFGPDEGLGVAVIVFEVGADGVFEFVDAAMDAPAQLFFRRQRKPALDQIKPGATSGGEVEMEAWMAQ
jgi:hypothetical protein